MGIHTSTLISILPWSRQTRMTGSRIEGLGQRKVLLVRPSQESETGKSKDVTLETAVPSRQDPEDILRERMSIPTVSTSERSDGEEHRRARVWADRLACSSRDRAGWSCAAHHQREEEVRHSRKPAPSRGNPRRHAYLPGGHDSVCAHRYGRGVRHEGVPRSGAGNRLGSLLAGVPVLERHPRVQPALEELRGSDQRSPSTARGYAVYHR